MKRPLTPTHSREGSGGRWEAIFADPCSEMIPSPLGGEGQGEGAAH
jgi:hypothetical protein